MRKERDEAFEVSLFPPARFTFNYIMCTFVTIFVIVRTWCIEQPHRSTYRSSNARQICDVWLALWALFFSFLQTIWEWMQMFAGSERSKVLHWKKKNGEKRNECPFLSKMGDFSSGPITLLVRTWFLVESFLMFYFSVSHSFLGTRWC